jgi:hypothetical protein
VGGFLRNFSSFRSSLLLFVRLFDPVHIRLYILLHGTCCFEPKVYRRSRKHIRPCGGFLFNSLELFFLVSRERQDTPAQAGSSLIHLFWIFTVASIRGADEMGTAQTVFSFPLARPPMAKSKFQSEFQRRPDKI